MGSVNELEARIRTLELELEEARKEEREHARLTGLHASARMRAEAIASDAVRAGARTVIAWLRGANPRVQIGRLLLGAHLVRGVRDELIRYLEVRLQASEEETLRVLPDSGPDSEPR